MALTMIPFICLKVVLGEETCSFRADNSFFISFSSSCLEVSSVTLLIRFPNFEVAESFPAPGCGSSDRRLGRAVSVFSTTSLISAFA
uniref:Secreted protein n=1 Tax=Anguilla anguilla TaxID=7936 RepID=A0A0E9WCW8_ANGAN